MPQKKKLSLEEARAMFSDKSEPPKKSSSPRNRGSKGSYNPSQGRSARSYSSRPQMTRSQIQERLERLERKIEHESLSPEEEDKLFGEIDKYENMLKKTK